MRPYARPQNLNHSTTTQTSSLAPPLPNIDAYSGQPRLSLVATLVTGFTPDARLQRYVCCGLGNENGEPRPSSTDPSFFPIPKPYLHTYIHLYTHTNDRPHLILPQQRLRPVAPLNLDVCPHVVWWCDPLSRSASLHHTRPDLPTT